MKYVSIDIETTGLDPEYHDILEIGAIVEDTKLKLPQEQCPTFHCYIDRRFYNGDAYALHLNARIFKRILELKKPENLVGKDLDDRYQYYKLGNDILIKTVNVVKHFKHFLDKNGIVKVIPAGKNYGTFDKGFLSRLPNWYLMKVHHRCLDPLMKYIDFETDLEPPDMKLCKQRAGLNEDVSHEALSDAWDVITLLRKSY